MISSVPGHRGEAHVDCRSRTHLRAYRYSFPHSDRSLPQHRGKAAGGLQDKVWPPPLLPVLYRWLANKSEASQLHQSLVHLCCIVGLKQDLIDFCLQSILTDLIKALETVRFEGKVNAMLGKCLRRNPFFSPPLINIFFVTLLDGAVTDNSTYV